MENIKYFKGNSSSRKSKFKSWLQTSCYIILVCFSLIGLLTVSNFFHEFNHYLTSKGIAEPAELCILNIPLTADNLTTFRVGYYTSSHLASDDEAYLEATKYSELNSKAIDLVVLFIFFGVLIGATKKFKKGVR